MIHGLASGSITDYAQFTYNCTLGQMEYRIPVTSLADVQLYIDFGLNAPSGDVTYQLIHTCGSASTEIETITPVAYVIGQDTNGNYYGVFQGFNEGTTAQCFVIAITIDSDIWFSQEYCFDPQCPSITEVKGCYGNLDPLISYDREGIYFGRSQGGTMGDSSVVYEHKFLMRDVELTLNAIKNDFKQGRTRTFRTESQDLLLFWGEQIPEWYIRHVDAVFKRGEVFIGSTKYLVDSTTYEKLDECFKNWLPHALIRESQFQSFSCELDPCTVPVEGGGGGGPTVCCDPFVTNATVNWDSEVNLVTINFTPCTPAPANGYVVLYRKTGSGGSYTNAGTFPGSPITFTAFGNEGDMFEGYIYSDCGGGLVGDFQPWDTGSVITYSISNTSLCGSSQFSNYLISGGTPGDTIVVRFSYSGALQRIGGLFTRANLTTFAPDGFGLLTNWNTPVGGCFADTGFHGFNLVTDRTFVMTGTTETVTSTAFVDNSNDSFNSMFVSIVSINGSPVSGIGDIGCDGTSATGGTC